MLTTLSLKTFSRVLTGSSLLFVAMMIVNVLNYGYALVLGRYFGPQQYGAYAAFISFFLLLTLFPMTLQQVNARFAATEQSVLVYTSRLAIIIGILVAGLLIMVSAPLSQLIHLPQNWLIGFAVLFPLYALLGVLRGETQGQQTLGLLGRNLILEHAFKIALTPVMLMFISGVSAAVAATLVAIPLTIRQLWFQLNSAVTSTISRPEVLRYALPVFVTLAAQAMIINADVILVNALQPVDEAGVFAAIALIGRVVFYGSWAVGAAVFPMVAARQRAGRGHLDLLWFALSAVALVSFGITAVCAVFPELIIRLLFGEAYLAGMQLIVPYAFMTSIYALANVISNHYLALGSHFAAYLSLFAAIVQVMFMLLMQESSLSIIQAQVWVKGGLLTILLLSIYGLYRKYQTGGNNVL